MPVPVLFPMLSFTDRYQVFSAMKAHTHSRSAHVYTMSVMTGIDQASYCKAKTVAYSFRTMTRIAGNAQMQCKKYPVRKVFSTVGAGRPPDLQHIAVQENGFVSFRFRVTKRGFIYNSIATAG